MTKEATGIQHVVECPALVPLLKTWSTADNEEEKKEAEQKIEAFFTEEINMIFLPTLGMEEERKEWNKCHPMKSEFKTFRTNFCWFHFYDVGLASSALWPKQYVAPKIVQNSPIVSY